PPAAGCVPWAFSPRNTSTAVRFRRLGCDTGIANNRTPSAGHVPAVHDFVRPGRGGGKRRGRADQARARGFLGCRADPPILALWRELNRTVVEQVRPRGTKRCAVITK